MLQFIYANDLPTHGDLGMQMYRDRAAQFRDRMKWDVDVDDQGCERDSYDALNPLYVIWTKDGQHAGSMRFLPTTGPTMVNDIFPNLLPDGTMHSALVWESTRFCLAPGARFSAAAALLLGGGEIMRNWGVKHFIGVFDAPMKRVYDRIGSSPDVVGTENDISAGLWSFSKTAQQKLADKSGVSQAQVADWFHASIAQMGQAARF